MRIVTFKRWAPVLAVAALLTFATPAYAGPSSGVYGGGGGGTENQLGSSGGNSPGTAASETRSASSGSLPFTGLDLMLMGGGAVVLIAAGAGLGRVVERRSEA